MTIAAGFVCKDGVLLCTDTEMTGWTAKTHATKMDQFDVAGGRLCFALAGASAFAWSAIQACRKQLQVSTDEDLGSRLEAILDNEYRRNVLPHPNYANLDYQLLLAVLTETDKPRLYATTATAMIEVKHFQCIGVGAELATYLIRPSLPEPTLREALTIAAYTLSCVKDSISGCGGMSVYTMLRKDGSTGTVTSFDGSPKQLDAYAKVFDFQTRRLLLWMSDVRGKDEYFRHNLMECFVKPICEARFKWKQEYQGKLDEFQNLNPHLSPEEAADMFADLCLGFVPRSPTP